MNYPIVYDKFDETYEGYGVAILENATEVRVPDEINGKHSLELVLPRNDPKWEYIQEDNYIKVDGHLYIIRTMDENRDESNRLLSNIQCEHIFFELLDEYIIYHELINVSAQAAAETFLIGTRFKVDATRITGNYDFEVEDCTPIVGINQILDHYKCEYECAGLPDPDGKIPITLYPELGTDDGVQFRYKKNIKSIRKSTDARGVVTRLYVFGKDGLGIETSTANTSGTPFIDSGQIGSYRIPKKGSKTFNDIKDPDELYQAGLNYLATIDTPKVSYEVNVLELKALADFGESESFQKGDTIRIIDEELNTDVYARIVGYYKYPFEPWRSRVVLANFRPGIEDYFSELDDTKRIVQKTTHKGKLNTFWLDGIIDTLQNQIKASGAYTTAEVIEGKGMLFENTDVGSVDYGALYIGPNILAIADSKVGENWDWRSFGKGSGFTADEINTGVLNAALVRILGEGAYLEIFGSNLIVYDNSTTPIERVKLGQYEPGKFGLRLKNKAGTATVLDEDGMLQSWQEGEEDNLDSTHPIVLDIYVPTETISIRKAILRFKKKAFRAYSTGSSSGGGTSTTTLSEDVILSIDAIKFYTNPTYNLGVDNVGSNHVHTGETSYTIPTVGSPDHYHDYRSMTSSGSHTHGAEDHGHYATVEGHSHSFSVPDHTHGINYGIYTSTQANNVKIIINGTDRTSDLGGGTGFTTDQDSLDIKNYLVAGQWNSVELTSTQLGRISGKIFMQCFLST